MGSLHRLLSSAFDKNKPLNFLDKLQQIVDRWKDWEKDALHRFKMGLRCARNAFLDEWYKAAIFACQRRINFCHLETLKNNLCSLFVPDDLHKKRKWKKKISWKNGTSFYGLDLITIKSHGNNEYEVGCVNSCTLIKTIALDPFVVAAPVTLDRHESEASEPWLKGYKKP